MKLCTMGERLLYKKAHLQTHAKRPARRNRLRIARWNSFRAGPFRTSMNSYRDQSRAPTTRLTAMRIPIVQAEVPGSAKIMMLANTMSTTPLANMNAQRAENCRRCSIANMTDTPPSMRKKTTNIIRIGPAS
jgi:hypothetical protein